MKRFLSIGRDPSCDIVLYDPTQVVSRSHATLRVDGRKYFITDHSTNGTYRNGIRLTPNMEYRITRDDEVSFGEAVLLNWDSVPGSRKSLLSYWPFFLIVLLAGILIFGVIYYLTHSKGPSVGNYPQPSSAVADTTASRSRTDSLVVLDNTIVSKPAVKQKSKSKRSGRKADPTVQNDAPDPTPSSDSVQSEGATDNNNTKKSVDAL